MAAVRHFWHAYPAFCFIAFTVASMRWYLHGSLQYVYDAKLKMNMYAQSICICLSVLMVVL